MTLKQNYLAVIYEQILQSKPTGIFDVHVYVGRTSPPRSDKYHKLVYKKIYRSWYNVDIKTLTVSLRWKLAHCQRRGQRHSKNIFTGVHNDLQWIRSVLNFELEFRTRCVGSKYTLRNHQRYMDEYFNCQFAGYGPHYCDNRDPSNNISNSMLARLFPSKFQ